jgi:hypothetical protein
MDFSLLLNPGIYQICCLNEIKSFSRVFNSLIRHGNLEIIDIIVMSCNKILINGKNHFFSILEIGLDW